MLYTVLGCRFELVDAPIYLVGKTILHFLECNAYGVLVVHRWPSAAFWPFLFEAGNVQMHFENDIIVFDKGQTICMSNNHSVSVQDLFQEMFLLFEFNYTICRLYVNR